MPERTPAARASYDAVATTCRGRFGLPSPPTTTGRPASPGRRSTSTAARNWSRSTWRIHADASPPSDGGHPVGAGSAVIGAPLELVVTTEDAELVALRVGEDEPPGARAANAAVIGDHGRAEREQARHLGVACPGARPEVEVHAVLRRLRLGHLDEQHAMTGCRILDHALLVTRLVRIVGEIAVTEHALPELGQGVGVGTVDGGVRD